MTPLQSAQRAYDAETPERTDPIPKHLPEPIKMRCICCGEWKPIEPMMHVCRECFEQ